MLAGEALAGAIRRMLREQKYPFAGHPFEKLLEGPDAFFRSVNARDGRCCGGAIFLAPGFRIWYHTFHLNWNATGCRPSPIAWASGGGLSAFIPPH